MGRKLLSYDAATGMVQYYHDQPDGGFGIETFQDSRVVSAILDRNKALANDDQRMKRGIKRGWMHAASIPIGVQHKWLQEEHFDLYEGSRGDKPHKLSPEGQRKFKRLLNSRDYSYLKTIPGKL